MIQRVIQFLRTKGRLLFILTVVIASVGMLSQVPPELTPPKFPMFDKVAHLVLFFGLATTLHFAFAPRVWVALVILGGYGALIEWVQYYIPNRGAEWEDLLADLLGVLLFYAVRWLWKRALGKPA
ncbi:MAG: VanZ-like family protein [Idiomarinaceae bacterium HL-53]|nr:MAG: VanZ-like family protein [Idiomarinaceae bacterium HL-53]CUS48338.1 VanZ like family protein [Idiomarinaceae bacterium HL-53]